MDEDPIDFTFDSTYLADEQGPTNEKEHAVRFTNRCQWWLVTGWLFLSGRTPSKALLPPIQTPRIERAICRHPVPRFLPVDICPSRLFITRRIHFSLAG